MLLACASTSSASGVLQPDAASLVEQAAFPDQYTTAPWSRQAPFACWWTDAQVVSEGRICHKSPPYASLKPALRHVTVPTAGRPLLDANLARKYASDDNMLIVTYINYNRVNFALTWVRHLEAEKQPHHIVAALDSKALIALEERGVASYLLNFSTLSGSDTGWGTKAFRQLGLFKVQMVLELARTGVDTLTVDADAFILRDPLPYFRKFPQADVLTSSDLLSSTNGYADTGLEGEDGFSSAFNIGFIFIRAAAVEFVAAWRNAVYAAPDAWDQSLFMQILERDGDISSRPREDRLRPYFKLASGRHLLVGVLPVSLFASGHTFFVTRMAHQMRTPSAIEPPAATRFLCFRGSNRQIALLTSLTHSTSSFFNPCFALILLV